MTHHINVKRYHHRTQVARTSSNDVSSRCCWTSRNACRAACSARALAALSRAKSALSWAARRLAACSATLSACCCSLLAAVALASCLSSDAVACSAIALCFGSARGSGATAAHVAPEQSCKCGPLHCLFRGCQRGDVRTKSNLLAFLTGELTALVYGQLRVVSACRPH